MSVIADMNRVREDVPQIVRDLKRIADVTDDMIAAFLGLKRGATRDRVAGAVPWSPWELVGLAEFFGVEVEIFYLDAREAAAQATNKYDVIGMGAERRADFVNDQGTRRSGWMAA